MSFWLGPKPIKKKTIYSLITLQEMKRNQIKIMFRIMSKRDFENF
jgi:hypothetical protein